MAPTQRQRMAKRKVNLDPDGTVLAPIAGSGGGGSDGTGGGCGDGGGGGNSTLGSSGVGCYGFVMGRLLFVNVGLVSDNWRHHTVQSGGNTVP
jgi:hypothetical protein